MSDVSEKEPFMKKVESQKKLKSQMKYLKSLLKSLLVPIQQKCVEEESVDDATEKKRGRT